MYIIPRHYEFKISGYIDNNHGSKSLILQKELELLALKYNLEFDVDTKHREEVEQPKQEEEKVC